VPTPADSADNEYRSLFATSLESATLRESLVRRLRRKGAIHTAAIESAFQSVPREMFLSWRNPPPLRTVYSDVPIVIGRDAADAPVSSCTLPSQTAAMLEALDLRPGHRVLEIGTGSGYSAALMNQIVGPGGTVISVELDRRLAQRAQTVLTRIGAAVVVVTSDGAGGWAARAPYDRIVVTTSPPSIPPAWRDQLAPDGRLAVALSPVAHVPAQLLAVLRWEHGGWSSVTALSGGFLHSGGALVHRRAPVRTLAYEEAGDNRSAIVDTWGGNLEFLSVEARRQVIASLMTKPKVDRFAAPESEDLIVNLALSLADMPVFNVERLGVGGIALATNDGSSVAVLPFSNSRGAVLRVIDRIETYGTGSASQMVHTLVRSWLNAGKPAPSDYQFRIEYSRTENVLGWKEVDLVWATMRYRRRQ
jgi:protein-L-isoaspartate(D-aspartate) O-methyltransferase